MRTSVSRYHRHRFPAEIISHSVWLYFRFALSFRDVEEMLAMRGVTLSYETIREWCLKFSQTYANGLRRRSSRPSDRDGTWMSIPKDQWSAPLSLACG
jgi:putative transposase